MCRFQCMGTAPDMHCTPAAAHVHKPYQFLQQTSVPALFTTEKKKNTCDTTKQTTKMCWPWVFTKV